MKLVILEEPNQIQSLRCQANGYRFSVKRSSELSHGAREVEVWVKYDGSKREVEIDFGDLPEKEERN